MTSMIGRRARDAVREHHHRLNGALNNMSQGLCMFDADNRLVVWNERYVEMYNVPPGPYLGRLHDPRSARCAHFQRHFSARS